MWKRICNCYDNMPNEVKVVLWVAIFSGIFISVYLIVVHFLKELFNQTSIVVMLAFLFEISLNIVIFLLVLAIVFIFIGYIHKKMVIIKNIGIYMLRKLFEIILLTVVVSFMVGIANGMVNRAFSEPSTNSPQTEEIENLKSRVE